MLQTLATAHSSHTACFICKEKNRNLHKVKKKDITHAFVNHRMVIKTHARCCDAHYDENGLIRKDEFFIIPTSLKQYSVETIKMFDLLSTNYISPFDEFREMKYLDDVHCKEITGWSKEVFIQFSEYITSIKNTKHRTKEQLIALYRYWLRTGVDQKSLAKMFGRYTRQTQISKYLRQIRLTIDKDFVPYFLGANKSREFFLKYNTVMTNELHNLDQDTLVIVADGTYCNIQKSKNNEFQYKTYSVQKTASLMKPFIACCADGYIIDCYGPFAANQNDSSILNYIIKSDSEFKKLLVAKKTSIRSW